VVATGRVMKGWLMFICATKSQGLCPWTPLGPEAPGPIH